MLTETESSEWEKGMRGPCYLIDACPGCNRGKLPPFLVKASLAPTDGTLERKEVSEAAVRARDRAGRMPPCERERERRKGQDGKSFLHRVNRDTRA
eukprot:762867-Hanusia_phi.AAC.2